MVSLVIFAICILAAWVILALAAGLLLGRGISMADRREGSQLPSAPAVPARAPRPL